VVGLTHVRAIAAGDMFTCALTSAAVLCWGSNYYGQLGSPQTWGAYSATPVLVYNADGTIMSGATAIAAGGSTACALISDGTVKCWGYNSQGQLGNGTITAGLPAPVAVPNLTHATAIASSDFQVCAIVSGGAVKCWGTNGAGELGIGTSNGPETCGAIACATSPVEVPGLTGVTAIAAGDGTTCALTSDGSASCWGNNSDGELGIGTNQGPEMCSGGDFGPGSYPCSTTPVQVPNLTGATAISVGPRHVCAVLSDATIRCWGTNTYGELGDGTMTDSLSPVMVKLQ
jgi:alpha-tubulin suppressor-like RCC1 family protein